MIPLVSPLFWQIKFLVDKLNPKAAGASIAEIDELVNLYGEDARAFLISCLLEDIVGKLGGSGKSASSLNRAQQQQKLQLLARLIRELLCRPVFVGVIGTALDNCFAAGKPPLQLTAENLDRLCELLGLTPGERVSLAVAVAHSSQPSAAAEGRKFFQASLAEFSQSDKENVLEPDVLSVVTYALTSWKELKSDIQKEGDIIERLLEIETAKIEDIAPLLAVPSNPANRLWSCESNPSQTYEDEGGIPLSTLGAVAMTEGQSASLAMIDIGYACTANLSSFREFLKNCFGTQGGEVRLLPEDIAKIIGVVARTPEDLDGSAANITTPLIPSTQGSQTNSNSGQSTARDDNSQNSAQNVESLASWNLDVLAQGIGELSGDVEWAKVARALDHDGFYVANIAGLRGLVALFRKLANQDDRLLFEALSLPWDNVAGQLSFLTYLFKGGMDILEFDKCPRRILIENEKSGSSTLQANPWLCVGLVESLLHVSESDYYADVMRLFDDGLKNGPEFVLLSVASAAPSRGHLLRDELFDRLIALFFGRSARPTSLAVFQKLWSTGGQHAKETVVHLVVKAYSKDPSLGLVGQIFALAKGLSDGLRIILDSAKVPIVLCLRLACFAADREAIQLAQWLADRVAVASIRGEDATEIDTEKERQRQLIHGCFAMVKDLGASAVPRVQVVRDGRSVLSLENVGVMLKVLHGSTKSGLFDAASVEHINRMYESFLKTHPQIAVIGHENVEEEANAYFQKIYTSEQSIDDVIEMLRKFRNSSISHEQEIFACMIHNLFDEYRFFHKYPEKELRITGTLFGSLVQHQLVSSVTLGLALRYVLEAIKKDPSTPAGGKMFRFGLFALQQFKQRLEEWPHYCTQLLQIPHLRQSSPQWIAELEVILTRAQGKAEAGSQAGARPMGVAQDVGGKLGGANLESEVGGSTGGPPLVGPVKSPLHIAGTPAPQRGFPLSPQQRVAHQGGPQQAAPSAMMKENMTSGSARGQGGKLSPLGSGKPTQGLQDTYGSGRNIAAAAAVQQQLSQGGRSVMPGNMATPNAANGLAGAGRSSPNTGSLAAANARTLMNLDKVLGPRSVDQGPPTVVPEERVQDRFYFIINNLTTGTLEGKVREAKELLESSFYPWVANTLVVGRICTQPNFHSVYISFVEKLTIPELEKQILDRSIQNVRKSLSSPKITTSAQERSLLKNLGSWIGIFTLSRSKVLLQRDIDVKELLCVGYETGHLMCVVPFVAKLLDGCKSSKAFRPPNPWVMGLMSTLREIYEVPDLKLNIKFEIEVLCKSLRLRLEDIKMGSTLRHRKVPPRIGNPDINLKTPTAQLTLGPTSPGSVLGGGSLMAGRGHDDAQGWGSVGNGTGATTGRSAVLSPQASAATSPAGASASAGPGALGAAFAEATVIPNLAAYVTINSTLSLFQEQPHLKRVIPVVVDRAIREIIQPVVERSVTIACITTRELVLKDFAMEPDENKMRKAAHLMVANLAGSLALVTCKEPLRVSMGNHLRSLLMTAPGVDPQSLEQLVQVCCSENLELGCMLIEKASTEKAMRDIDEMLAGSFNARRKSREQDGQPFYDMSIFQNRSAYPAALPPSLRPKPGGLTSQHYFVYDAFQRFPRHPQVVTPQANLTPTSPTRPEVGTSSTSPSLGLGPGPVLSAVAGHVSGGTSLASAPGAQVPGGQSLSGSASLEKLELLVNRFCMATKDLAQQAGGALSVVVSALSGSSPVIVTVRDICTTIQCTEPSSRADVCLGISQKLFKRLFELGSGPREQDVVQMEFLVALMVEVDRAGGASGRAGEHRNEDSGIGGVRTPKGSGSAREGQSADVGLDRGASAGSDVARGARHSPSRLATELTEWMVYPPLEEHKMYGEIAACFVRAKLLLLRKFDSHLASNLENNRNMGPTVELTVNMIRQGLVPALASPKINLHDPSVQHAQVTQPVTIANDLAATFEALGKVIARHGPNNKQLASLGKVLETAVAATVDSNAAAAEGGAATKMGGAATNAAGPSGESAALPAGRGVLGSASSGMDGMMGKSAGVTATAGMASQLDGKGQMPYGGSSGDPAGSREQAVYLLEHWIRIWSETPGNEKAYAAYLSLLQQQGIWKSNDSAERFFRLTTEIVIENCLRMASRTHEQQKGTTDGTGAPGSESGRVGGATQNQSEGERARGGGADGSSRSPSMQAGSPTSGNVFERLALSYGVVDAYSRLLILLVRYVDPASVTSKVSLLSKILTTISGCIVRAHKQGISKRSVRCPGNGREDQEKQQSQSSWSGVVGESGKNGAPGGAAGSRTGEEVSVGPRAGDPSSDEKLADNAVDMMFDQRPYCRLLVNLLHDLNTPDAMLDMNMEFNVVAAFVTTFHGLRPKVVPGFAFAWLELVSHRYFMPALLLAKGQKGWPALQQLFMDLFSFLSPYLSAARLPNSIRLMYKGTMRVLLVLLHDFPEFLCDYHLSFCDAIPPTCIQLRNLVLSAFPRNIRLPDPFTPNLKVDLLPEISQAPRVSSNYTAILEAARGTKNGPGDNEPSAVGRSASKQEGETSILEDIEQYLRSRQPLTLLEKVLNKIYLPSKSDADGKTQNDDSVMPRNVPSESGRYNVPVINGLVLYVGSQAIAQLQSKSSGSVAISHSAPMDIFQHLATELDAEGRYLFLNAIANNLRYPNSHTHYFSCVLLYLFAEARSEKLKEQITRVLLERLIVHRPHPWGLLITFIELIKNPRYNFWSHSFTHCAKEIEGLFESVARSCMGSAGGSAASPTAGGLASQGRIPLRQPGSAGDGKGSGQINGMAPPAK